MIIIGYKKCENTPASRHNEAIKLRDTLISAYLNAPDDYISLSEKGRPMLKIKGADISVSHCEDIVMVGLSISFDCERKKESALKFEQENTFIKVLETNAQSIGVDIEAVQYDKDIGRYKRIVERCFSKGEKEILNTITDKDKYITEFLKMWTAKESICKMSGVGLSGIRSTDTTKNKNDYTLINDKITLHSKEYIFTICVK